MFSIKESQFELNFLYIFFSAARSYLKSYQTRAIFTGHSRGHATDNRISCKLNFPCHGYDERFGNNDVLYNVTDAI